jgi:hypothetical protein
LQVTGTDAFEEAAMEKIVPLPGLRVKGPLGVAHLPRLWLKCVLGAAGALPEGYTTSNVGTNAVMIEGIGLEPDSVFAYLATRPAYAAFEAWVRERATKLNAEAITATNARIGAHQKPAANAAEVRARTGVADDSIGGAALLNELDDWATVHAAIAASEGRTLQPIVPAVSTQSTGPLGLMHLPRFWMKATLAAAGALYEDWKSGPDSPLDMWFCAAIGLEPTTAIAHIRAERPSYMAFEGWVSANVPKLGPDEIAKTNATLNARQKPEEVAARERALLGITDPGYRPSIELNDLVDWHQLHANLASRAARA